MKIRNLSSLILLSFCLINCSSENSNVIEKKVKKSINKGYVELYSSRKKMDIEKEFPDTTIRKMFENFVKLNKRSKEIER